VEGTSYKVQVESGKCVGRIRAQPAIRHGGRSPPDKTLKVETIQKGFCLMQGCPEWQCPDDLRFNIQ